jgi:hypothetical protein
MPEVAIVDNRILLNLISKIEEMGNYVEELKAEAKSKQKPYLTAQELMELTGFGKTWVNDNKQLIGFTTVGGCLRFKRKDVEDFMEQNYFKAKK